MGVVVLPVCGTAHAKVTVAGQVDLLPLSEGLLFLLLLGGRSLDVTVNVNLLVSLGGEHDLGLLREASGLAASAHANLLRVILVKRLPHLGREALALGQALGLILVGELPAHHALGAHCLDVEGAATATVEEESAEEQPDKRQGAKQTADNGRDHVLGLLRVLLHRPSWNALDNVGVAEGGRFDLQVEHVVAHRELSLLELGDHFARHVLQADNLFSRESVVGRHRLAVAYLDNDDGGAGVNLDHLDGVRVNAEQERHVLNEAVRVELVDLHS
mmetsp:Transcript_4007/g.9510  ORF Transcript_4007/g.9510 Transcript_4007/m.9510 type:complete len:273 (-) Transcript_4007:10298-11116(-)